MESQKSSSRRATFQRKKEAGEGRRERETKQNVFDERGKKREYKREREFKAHLDDDGGLDGLHSCIEGKKETDENSLRVAVEKVKERER